MKLVTETKMSLQFNDLRNLIGSKIHIDEYRSKMGDDDDVIVVSFKVKYYDPALELSNFIEKGYDWVLDSDVSAGEMKDGSYLVFVEALRRPSFPDHLINLLEDLAGSTGNDPDGYEFAYYKEKGYVPLTADNLRNNVTLDPRKYRAKNGDPDKVDAAKEDDKALESLQMAAGLAPKAKPITDPELAHFVNLSKR